MNVALQHNPSALIQRLVDARRYVPLLGCGKRGERHCGYKKEGDSTASQTKGNGSHPTLLKRICRPDRPLLRYAEVRTRSPSSPALIHRAAAPPDNVLFPDFVGEAAAHHNAGKNGVKYKLWCKMWPRAPRSCRERKWRCATMIQKRRRKSKSTGRKKPPQIRSAPNSRELLGARTALPQVCSRKRLRPTAKSVHSTFVLIM